MPFTFTLPQTGSEALVMLVPFITALLGFAYLLAPKAMLASSGIEAKPEYPEAVGEGRASYGGILLAFGLCCLLLQEPKALQPGLNTVLALAWFLSTAAYLTQIIKDRQKQVSSFVRLALGFMFFIIVWENADPVSFGLVLPGSGREWIIAAIAIFTLALGLIALFTPKLALKVMRLKPAPGKRVCICGPRGILGGFYVAAGVSIFIIKEPAVAGLWLQMLLGAIWLFTGMGRMVAMVFDPGFMSGFTLYNIAGLIFEFCLAGIVLGMVLGFL